MPPLCVIVIPVYKSDLTDNEIASIQQCIKILHHYPVVFIAPDSLRNEFYKKQFPTASFKYFSDRYFNNLNSYSKLMLSYWFYRKFRNYEYLLMFQPDAWIFKDELSFWCNKAYDYIGAPLIKSVCNNEILFFKGGNGGLSLRKISSCLKVLTSFSYITKPLEIWRNRKKEVIGIVSFMKNIIGLFLDVTIRNNTFFLFNNFYWNEDGFWSVIAPRNFSWFKTATVEEAIRFSFEQYPSLLFEKTNHELPFGCHAWEKYEPDFWKHFIR